MTVKQRHAEIAGAGFAGLATAIALCHRGWSVRVHEANADLREVGAGIFLWENGMLTLDALGVLDDVLAGAWRAPASEVRVNGQQVSLQQTNTAETYPMLSMKREVLYAALLKGAQRAGADIRTNSPVIGATPEGSLLMKSGEHLRADLVIGADGVNSRVRDSLDLLQDKVHYNDGIIRTLVDRKGFSGGEWDRVIDFWSKGPSVRRVLYTPCDENTIYLALMASTQDRDGIRVPLDRELWAEAVPELAGLIAQVGERVRYDSYQAFRVSKWSRGRAVLVGDSAQAMPPTLGQGAGVALMNALALAVALDEHKDIAEALASWESRERPFTTQIQQQAEQLAEMGAARSELPKTVLGDSAQKVPTGSLQTIPDELNVFPTQIKDLPWYKLAWELVLQRHQGHKDRLDRPMEEHFIRVSNRLMRMFPQSNPAQLQAALLHDALEPGGYTEEQLQSAGVTTEALRIIRNITLPTDDQSYLDYARDLAKSGDRAAIQVKLADNQDAVDLFTAVGGEEGKRRIQDQYKPSITILVQALPKRLQAAVPIPA